VYDIIDWAHAGVGRGSDVKASVPHVKSERERILLWDVEVRLDDSEERII
jgi:hypothetical protein